MADQDRTLEISDLQREALKALQGMSAKHILCGMLGSLAHAPIPGSRLSAFMKVMQGQMPEMFHVFGEHPLDHIRVLVPNVLVQQVDATFKVREDGLEELRKELENATGRDLSHANSATWILAALFVQFRGSMRPPTRAPQAKASSAAAK